ncbi:MAG: hypothetical protein K8F91_09180 [Candidatus Obscuribacterales bacterium]|nr:hypothetical protein [Candidatus Obscuribacterales bacterium]
MKSGLRFNKRASISLLSLAICSGLWLTGAPAHSARPEKSEKSVPSRDNSGRQLAVATTGTGESEDDLQISPASQCDFQLDLSRTRAARLLSSLSARILPESLGAEKIIEDIPEQADKILTDNLPHYVIDYSKDLSRAGGQALVVVREHAVVLGGQLAQFFRQLLKSTTLSPLNSPSTHSYAPEKLVPSDFGERSAKKFLTSQGRLKTVVTR